MDETEFWNKMGFILSSEIRAKIFDLLLKDSMIIQNSLAKTLNSDNSTVSNNLKAMVIKKIIILLNPDNRKGKIYKLSPELEANREKMQEILRLRKKVDNEGNEN